MKRKEFKEIEVNNPDSRIWGREFSYQKARDHLARVLNKWYGKLETPARINYLVEKIFSVKRNDNVGGFVREKISKEDYDFVLWLSTKNLKKFHSKIKNWVLKSWHYLRENDNGDELPDDYSKYLGQFESWNQMLRFISQVRNDVHSETFRVLDFWIDQKMSESLTDEMKSIYPNREEMVAENKAETKEENIVESSVAEKKVEDKKE